MDSLINQTASIEFHREEESIITPKIFNEKSTSAKLLIECLQRVPVGSKLMLQGIILDKDEEYVWLFTSCGLLQLDSEKVTLSDESDVIRVEPIEDFSARGNS